MVICVPSALYKLYLVSVKSSPLFVRINVWPVTNGEALTQGATAKGLIMKYNKCVIE